MAPSSFYDVLPLLVDRICASSQFRSAEQLAKFLRYLSEKTIAQIAVKACDVAREYLSKSGAGSADAARALVFTLKVRLRDYYSGDGRTEDVRIGVQSRPYRIIQVQAEEKPRARQVKPAEFARLVQAICRLEGIGAVERSRRFRRWRSEPNLKSRLHAIAHISGHEDFDQFLAFLQQKEHAISVSDLREVALLFGIHPLLLDPLLSEPERKDCLRLSLNENFIDITEGGDAFRGKKSSYLIPDRRLERADVAFVKLKLKANGRSDTHEHPGDELMLVRSGTIEVCFELSGITTILGEGDIIHFYAEQRHKVVARKSAEVFIVRLYQLDAEKTRQTIWRNLEDVLTSETPTQVTALPADAIGWIRQLLPTYRPEPVIGVADVLGITRFLERWQSVRSVVTAAQSSAGPESKLGPDTSSIPGHAAALPNILGDIQLDVVAKAYGVEEFLLHNFSFPAISGAVLIRPTDFKEVPNKILPEGVRYSLPCRNLSCSDISIAKVTLAPQAATAPNEHPGFEALLMLRGTAHVRYDDLIESVCEISSERMHLCHFNSSRRHTIANPSTGESAEFLVIRFYRDGARLP